MFYQQLKQSEIHNLTYSDSFNGNVTSNFPFLDSANLYIDF